MLTLYDRHEEENQHTTWGFVQVLLDVVSFNISNSIWRHIQLDIINLAFSCYLQIQFFNQQRLWADDFQIQHLHKALPVSGKFTERHHRQERTTKILTLIK